MKVVDPVVYIHAHLVRHVFFTRFLEVQISVSVLIPMNVIVVARELPAVYDIVNICDVAFPLQQISVLIRREAFLVICYIDSVFLDLYLFLESVSAPVFAVDPHVYVSDLHDIFKSRCFSHVVSDHVPEQRNISAVRDERPVFRLGKSCDRCLIVQFERVAFLCKIPPKCAVASQFYLSCRINGIVHRIVALFGIAAARVNAAVHVSIL